LSPIRSYTFQVIVSTSAYLGHYAEPLLVGQSRSTRACGWHLLRKPGEPREVTPFLVSVWCWV